VGIKRKEEAYEGLEKLIIFKVKGDIHLKCMRLYPITGSYGLRNTNERGDILI